MTLKLIDEVYLYTSNNPEHLLKSLELIAWFDHTDIQYTSVQYPNFDIIRDPINSWWIKDIDTGITQEPLTEFPFVVYTEMHEDNITRRKYIFGKENIINNLPEIYSIGR